MNEYYVEWKSVDGDDGWETNWHTAYPPSGFETLDKAMKTAKSLAKKTSKYKYRTVRRVTRVTPVCIFEGDDIRWQFAE